MDQAAMAATASFLHERTAGEVDLHPVASQDRRRAERQMVRWAERVGRGHPERLDRRLALDGHDRASALRLFAPATWPSGRPLPPWTDTLAAVGARAQSVVAATTPDQFAQILRADRSRHRHAPLPFDDVVLPFVRHARDRLDASGRWNDWQPAARAALERGLLQRLSYLGRYALLARFATDRARRGYATNGGAATYQAFVRSTWAEGAEAYARYPVLGRLLAQTTRQAVAAMQALDRRLTRDRSALRGMVGDGQPLGAVVEARAGLSDPHDGGQTVALLRFASGAAVVYKPRSLGTGCAYRQIVRWLDRRGMPFALRAPRSLCRGTYGWQEQVEAADCAGPAEARAYYRRCGALLALAYALGGRDFHGENLIAAGPHPVPVDLEMITAPRLADRHRAPSAETPAHGTVFETGFLPEPDHSRPGRPDVSGFGADDVQTVSHVAWRGVGTDRITCARVNRPLRHPLRNVATLDGRRVDPAAHADALRTGFAATYRFLARRRSAVGAVVRSSLEGRTVRYLLRDTRAYGAILHAATHPQSLQHGPAFSVQIDALAAGLVHDAPSPALWQAFLGERDALHRGDVPLLSAPTDSTALHRPERPPVPAFFERSGLARVDHRLARLSDDDLRTQLAHIQTSFAPHSTARIA